MIVQCMCVAQSVQHHALFSHPFTSPRPVCGRYHRRRHAWWCHMVKAARICPCQQCPGGQACLPNSITVLQMITIMQSVLLMHTAYGKAHDMPILTPTSQTAQPTGPTRSAAPPGQLSHHPDESSMTANSSMFKLQSALPLSIPGMRCKGV